MDRQTIGKWIGGRRKKLGLTQSYVGSKLSYTPQAISLIEQGKSSMLISTLYPLAETLQCNPEDIMECSKEVESNYRVYEYNSAQYSANLKKYRKAMHLKQADLAAMLGVSSRTLRTYEKDKATPTIEFIDAFLGVAKIKLTDLERE